MPVNYRISERRRPEPVGHALYPDGDHLGCEARVVARTLGLGQPAAGKIPDTYQPKSSTAALPSRRGKAGYSGHPTVAQADIHSNRCRDPLPDEGVDAR